MTKFQSDNQVSKISISKESFLLYAPISVISVPLAITEQLTPEKLLTSLLGGISATILCAFYFVISSRFARNFTRTKNISSYFVANLLFIMSIGAIRGLLVYKIFTLANITNPTSMSIRVLTSTATTLFWLCSISVIVNDFRSYRDKLETLIRTSLFNYMKIEKKPRHQSVDLSQEFESIETMLRQVLGEINTNAHDKNALIAAATHVKGIIDQVVRPLSHRLWVDRNSLIPRIKVRDTVIDGVRLLKVPPHTVSSLLLLLSLFNLSADYGVKRGIGGSLALCFTSFILFFFIQKYTVRAEKNLFLKKLFLLFLISLSISVVIYILNVFGFNLETAEYSFVFVPLIMFLSVLISIRELTVKDRDYLVEQLEKNRITATDNQYNQISNNDAASFLHNSLQSELLALSLQLENIAKNPDSERTRAILEQIGARINRSIGEEFQDFDEAPIDRLHRVISAWEGIVEIHTDIPEEAFENLRRNRLLVQIIEEAINNAVRSAQSKRIEIRGRLGSDGKLLLIIRNQGSWDPKERRSFGSDWLDEVVAGNWKRRREGDWTILEIKI